VLFAPALSILNGLICNIFATQICIHLIECSKCENDTPFFSLDLFRLRWQHRGLKCACIDLPIQRLNDVLKSDKKQKAAKKQKTAKRQKAKGKRQKAKVGVRPIYPENTSKLNCSHVHLIPNSKQTTSTDVACSQIVQPMTFIQYKPILDV
jgi:hypothetical protein